MKAQKYKQNVKPKRKNEQIMLQDSDMVISVSVVQDQESPGHTTNPDHLSNFLTEDRMISRFVW